MRKNTLLIFAAILLVGGSFVFAEYRNKQSQSVYTAKDLAISNVIDTTAQEIDTDGDGSKDWEEILAGTNPLDPKSKPTFTKTEPTKDITKTPTEKLEPVDLISRDFFARYMELRQSGASADKASQQELVNNTVNKIKLSEAKPYMSSEIKVRADNGKESVKIYGNEIATIFKKYAFVGTGTRNEGVIAKDALGQQDENILKELDPIIQSDKNIVNGILKTEAPQAMATMHLDMLNSMNTILFVAQSFKKVIADPLAGIQASIQYIPSRNGLIKSMRAVQSYFKYLGITYDASEPGVLFVPLK